MSYSKKQFAQELKEQLDYGFDVVRISQWAYGVYLDSRELEPGLIDIIMQVQGMDSGPEFEFTENELRKLADELLQE